MPEITNQIYYVGVNDRNKELFEGLWPLPNGVSYNSYLIVDEKICLIDTVEVDFFIQYLENIHEVIGDRPIDYLVVNHMEPDHSGSIALIRKYYPEIKIVGNKKTFGMAEGFYGIADNLVEVKNNDTLQLGAHTLQFVLTPMVHWPETMVTLDTTSHVLFSGDAFGCFGALNGAYVDEQMNCDDFWLEMTRYYSNIVGKYGTPVQMALKKLAGVKVDYICSTHGPVWHEHVGRVIGIYDRLSRYEAEPGLVICYGTMYGPGRAEEHRDVQRLEDPPLVYHPRPVPLPRTHRRRPDLQHRPVPRDERAARRTVAEGHQGPPPRLVRLLQLGLEGRRRDFPME